MRILVCPPDHFDVDYVINPWMEGQVGCVDFARARSQWDALFEEVAREADLEVVAPRSGSPDMCFTANAGLVEGGRALPARFRMPERRAEAVYFSDWLSEAGYSLEALAGPDAFEGEGDALFQPGEALIWAGYGVRTALETHRDLARIFGVEVVSLRLVDQHFYHLDTCFAPLPDGRLLYYPSAFDERSRLAIASRIPADHRIAVSERDAMRFACNALVVGERIFMNAASDSLRGELARWGFDARIHCVDEFLKAGGGVKCLSLQLEQSSFERDATPIASPIESACLELCGDLLDAGLLRRALDLITDASGSFRIDALDLAERKDQPSRASIRVVAPDEKLLAGIVEGLVALGAGPAAGDRS